MIRFTYLCLLAIMFLMATSCSDISDIKDAELVSDVSVAVPLINTQLKLDSVSERLDGLTSIVLSPNGQATIKYNSEVIRQDANAIFPVYPVPVPIVITGPNSVWSLEEAAAQTGAFANNVIRKAIFQNNKVFFLLQHTLEEDVTFTITIPEFTLNGVAFTETYTVPPRANDTDVFNTETSSLDEYLFVPVDNSLNFQYTATDGSGSDVEMAITAMKLDFLNFSYVEGYFDERTFDIQGDVINVGLFDKWISGGLEFEDPKVSVKVENAFGFPVKTDFQELRFTTVSGLVYDIESDIIENGVEFNFPTLDEVGEIKETSFDFNKNNSTIEDIFLDKIASVSFDIDAIANPGGDTTIDGFLNNESYFRIDVSVDLPLHGIINELVITDTIDIDLIQIEDINSAEFKFIIKNDYPATVNVQAVILNGQNNAIDVVFEGDGIQLAAATLGADGRTIGGETTIEYVDIQEDRIDVIKNGKRVVLVATIDSRNVSDDFLWFYSDYEVDFKLGAIFNLKN